MRDLLFNFWTWTTHDSVAFYTFVLALFTGVLAISTIGLWIVTWRTARKQSEETKILQRAYIAAEPLGVRPFNYGIEMLGYVGYRNVGNIPARNVRYLTKIEFSVDRHKFSDGFSVEDPLWGNNVISSGTTMTQAALTKITSEQEDAVKQGNGYIYVWGTIHYDDGFGVIRFTNFCHRYNFRSYAYDMSGGISGEQILSGTEARHHEFWNDAI